jgi:hypothetical protein
VNYLFEVIKVTIKFTVADRVDIEVDKHKEALDMNDNKDADENLLNVILVEKGMRELASLKVFFFFFTSVFRPTHICIAMCLPKTSVFF